MLDEFLTVACDNDTKKKQSVKLARDLQRLPNETLYAIASGRVKLAFGDSEEWLEKYRGTELFDQAMALEKAGLENDVARSQADAARPQMNQFSDTADQIRLQKKMLDLQLVEHMEGQGAPMQAGGMLPDQITPTAQGAGALGDMAAEGASDGAVGMQGKMAAAFRKAAGLSGAAIGALGGAALGAGAGALTGGPDYPGAESHRLRNALIGGAGGAALGGTAGHFGQGMLKKTEQVIPPQGKTPVHAAPVTVAPATHISPPPNNPPDVPIHLDEHAITVDPGKAALERKRMATEKMLNTPQVDIASMRMPQDAPAPAMSRVQGDPFPGVGMSRTGIPQHEIDALDAPAKKQWVGAPSAWKPWSKNGSAEERFLKAAEAMKLASVEMNFRKAAAGFGTSALNLARKNTGLIGAGVGAGVGALTAGRDPQTGQKHWVRGALGGAAVGGAAGHAAGGIANRMSSTAVPGLAGSGQNLGFHEAVKGYGGDTYNAVVNKAGDLRNRIAPSGGRAASAPKNTAAVSTPGQAAQGAVSRRGWPGEVAGNLSGPAPATYNVVSNNSPKLLSPRATTGTLGSESAGSGRALADAVGPNGERFE